MANWQYLLLGLSIGLFVALVLWVVMAIKRRASLSFVMVWCSIPLLAIAQYPFLVFPFRYAFHSGIPSFIRFFTLVLGNFHCFQMYIRIRRRSHSFQSCISFFISAIP